MRVGIAACPSAAGRGSERVRGRSAVAETRARRLGAGLLDSAGRGRRALFWIGTGAQCNAT